MAQVTPYLRGGKNGKWKGGTTVSNDGYLRITAGPLRNVYVHILVLEAKLHRKLASNEEAHHINGDRLDPRPENLEPKTIEEHRPFLNGRPKWRRGERRSPLLEADSQHPTPETRRSL